MTKSSSWFDVYYLKKKSTGRFCQIFQDFSEYMNFTWTMDIAKETESGVVTAKKVVGKIKYFFQKSLDLYQDAWSMFYLSSAANYTNSRIG